MNELQIIQQHLATERQHFAQVATACAAALSSESQPADESVLRACADYFDFALMRLQSDPAGEARAALDAARAALDTRRAAHVSSATRVASEPTYRGAFRAFLQAFMTECSRHFAGVDTLVTSNGSVARWRALARLDADAIVGERERFARVQAGLALAP